jgi:predicted ATPase
VLARVTQGGAASAGELNFEVRRLFERVASAHPLVVVLDDLHWAEPTFLDLLDHVADLSREAPILLLCIARPELLEERTSWAGGKLNATTHLLEPLAPGVSRALIEQLGWDLDADARARVVEAGEGNPLFLEEMVALVQEGGGTDVPPTIQALLGARLERLAEPERTVIERGAVEGKVFHRGAVFDLSPQPQRDGVDAHLAALVRKELIRPDEPIFEGDEAYRFRHLLIRDAAYDALPKGQRAELHAAFAGWLEHQGAPWSSWTRSQAGTSSRRSGTGASSACRPTSRCHSARPSTCSLRAPARHRGGIPGQPKACCGVHSRSCLRVVSAAGEWR